MLLKLIKLPLRLAAIPVLLALLVLQLLGTVLLGLSSVEVQYIGNRKARKRELNVVR